MDIGSDGPDDVCTYRGTMLRVACIVIDAVGALEKLYSGREVSKWDRRAMGWTADFLEKSRSWDFGLNINHLMKAAPQAQIALGHKTCYDTRIKLYNTLRTGMNQLSLDEFRAARISLVDFSGGILEGLAFG